jgi:hypothetical protein
MPLLCRARADRPGDRAARGRASGGRGWSTGLTTRSSAAREFGGGSGVACAFKNVELTGHQITVRAGKDPSS